MKKAKIVLIVLLFVKIACVAQVGIGTSNPNESAILDVNSSSKGFLPPRMTIVERNNIKNPSQGLLIYCQNCCSGGTLSFFDSQWKNTPSCESTDNDDDGVPDDIDIDDDNDGILDIDEYALAPVVNFNTPSVSSGTDLNAFNSASITHNNTTTGKIEQVIVDLDWIDTGMDFHVNGVGILNNTQYMEFDYIATGIPTTPGVTTTYLTTDGNVPSGNPVTNYVYNPYTATPLFPRVRIIIKDNEPVEVWGSIWYSAFVKLQASNGENFKSFTFNSGNNTFTVLNRDSEGADGMEGSMKVYYYIDTDGDGVKNSYDTDSDGDNCPDASESGFVAQADPDFNFSYLEVGANGLVDSLETTADNGELI